MDNPGQAMHTRRVRVNLEYEVDCGDTFNLSMEEIFSTVTQGKIDARLCKSCIEIIDQQTGEKIAQDEYVQT